MNLTHCNDSELLSAALAFVRWLETTGGVSYDPYDLWGTRYGLLARRLYYAKHPLGVPLTAPLVLLEMLCPRLRALFVRRDHYPTADAQLVLGFLNLHAITGEAAHLRTARRIAASLLQSSIPGYRGHCWGYPFDWQNNKGLWKKNTPFITATPYAFEAFLGLFDATGEAGYRGVAESAARFVDADLKDTPTGPDAAAASYSPHDESLVINASAYRAFVLIEAARRFGSSAYEEKARRNLNFILQQQRDDGSWLYAINNPAEAFIDHFHTCFVLKNLAKLNRHLQEARVRTAIRRGYDYLRRALFDADDNPRLYALRPRTELVRLEMYNVAEDVTLGTLLREEVPEAFTLAQKLAGRLCREWQRPAGYFLTRIYRGGWRHTLPFLRWPQAQLFLALTNLLLALETPGRAAAARVPARPEAAAAAR